MDRIDYEVNKIVEWQKYDLSRHDIYDVKKSIISTSYDLDGLALSSIGDSTVVLFNCIIGSGQSEVTTCTVKFTSSSYYYLLKVEGFDYSANVGIDAIGKSFTFKR